MDKITNFFNGNNLENLSNTNNSYGKQDKRKLQEQFINEYAYAKGWNVNSLTSEQLLEITNQKGYKNPLQMNS